VAALRDGELVFDRVFDDLFPPAIRRASSVHWTPVEIAVRAARLLTEGVAAPVVLDVGAGVGKFCAIAAATAKGTIRGVEHRAHFVEIAREVSSRLGVEATFEHGSIEAADLDGVTGLYLFNPFAENLAPADDHLDETVQLGEDSFWRDVAAVERYLERAPVGTRVVTYCGWGGAVPNDYDLVLREGRAGTLELWRRSAVSKKRVARERAQPRSDR
jgi:SAM-dependent methyltransferase